MPLTRSTSQKSLPTPTRTPDDVDNFSTSATPVRRNKRTLASAQTPLKTPTPRKKAKNAGSPATPAEGTPVKPLPVFQLTDASKDASRMIPGKLGFDFEQAKRHLCSVDARFETLFERLKCKPFENLEAVDPFRYGLLLSQRAGLTVRSRSLCTSIVGQQVSWLAARAINHRFRRLFDPSLPEKADDKTSEGWGA
jgi:DNA-3-methyladenine glycosylase II